MESANQVRNNAEQNLNCTIAELHDVTVTQCIACAGNLTILGKKSDYFYQTCNDCKTVQIAPLPSKLELEQAYKDSQYALQAHGQEDPSTIYASSRPYYKCIADTLSDYNVTGLVIDYGAGWGGLCSLLLEYGFNCQGVELASNMVAACQKMQLPVKQGTLATLRETGSRAQAIVLCGVFEHLVDPRQFLQDAYALLDNDGLLVSLQPTAPFASVLAFITRLGRKKLPLSSLFYVFDAPWHVALYSMKGMQHIAEQSGFELVEVRFTPQGRVAGLYGIAQRILEWTNRIGWKIFQNKWPLLVSHTFVFKKCVELR